ncbi:DNA oxidative demethylase ALKBH2 [Gastrophryne carolinensis]
MNTLSSAQSGKKGADSATVFQDRVVLRVEAYFLPKISFDFHRTQEMFFPQRILKILLWINHWTAEHVFWNTFIKQRIGEKRIAHFIFRGSVLWQECSSGSLSHPVQVDLTYPLKSLSHGIIHIKELTHKSHSSRNKKLWGFYMDKFIIKKTFNAKRGQSEDGEGGHSSNTVAVKKMKTEESDSPQERGCMWKRIRADNLCCDYTILFSRLEANEIFQQLEREIEYFSENLSKVHVFGKWHRVPRKQVTYGDDGLAYTFSGITLSPKPWIPVLDQIRDKVKYATSHSFNFVLINRYKDGNDHIGDHRDDEKELVPESPIASVSFGACRDFVFRHRDSRFKKSAIQIEPVKLLLEHGSLLMMNFPTNVYWYHGLPIRKKVLAPRVNLTFRKLIPQNQR